jgi:hypothetical protein
MSELASLLPKQGS